MSEERGEYIYLCWEGHRPLYHAIRGHVDEAAAREALRGHGVDMDDLRPPQHLYALKAQTAMCRQEGWGYELRLYDERGSGRFPVTVCYEEDPHAR